jgi:hypothetical protein
MRKVRPSNVGVDGFSIKEHDFVLHRTNSLRLNATFRNFLGSKEHNASPLRRRTSRVDGG